MASGVADDRVFVLAAVGVARARDLEREAPVSACFVWAARPRTPAPLSTSTLTDDGSTVVNGAVAVGPPVVSVVE